MLKAVSLTAVAVLSLFLVVPMDSGAAEKADEKGWISLFNGKDFTGWRISEDGNWKVEDGVIVGGGNRSHVFSDQKFKDFEFKTECQLEPGSNSGVYFHSDYVETWPVVGLEVQLNNTHGDPRKTGSLWGVTHAFESAAKDNEWFELHVKVVGNHVQTFVNGKMVIDYIQPNGVTDDRRVREEGGSFALQAHDPKSVMKFRNIRVKPLDSKKSKDK